MTAIPVTQKTAFVEKEQTVVSRIQTFYSHMSTIQKSLAISLAILLAPFTLIASITVGVIYLIQSTSIRKDTSFCEESHPVDAIQSVLSTQKNSEVSLKNEDLSLAFYINNIGKLDPQGTQRKVYTYLAKETAKMDPKIPYGMHYWTNFYLTCGFLDKAVPFTASGEPILKINNRMNVIYQVITSVKNNEIVTFDNEHAISEAIKPICETMQNCYTENMRIFLPILLQPKGRVGHGALMVIEGISRKKAKITLIDPFGDNSSYRRLGDAYVQAAKSVFSSPETTTLHNTVKQQTDGKTCTIHQIENIRVLLEVDNIQDHVRKGKLPKRSEKENLENFKSYIEFAKSFCNANSSVDVTNVEKLAIDPDNLQYYLLFDT